MLPPFHQELVVPTKGGTEMSLERRYLYGDGDGSAAKPSAGVARRRISNPTLMRLRPSFETRKALGSPHRLSAVAREGAGHR